MSKFTCEVCGFNGLDEAPWGADGKTPSFDICPCCGVEFGYEDATDTGKANFRTKWIATGGKWFDESKKPNRWDIKEQLAKIGVKI